ncbi:MAG TPA: T9SS type A sorting domain-containing protein [bacterium]
MKPTQSSSFNQPNGMKTALVAFFLFTSLTVASASGENISARFQKSKADSLAKTIDAATKLLFVKSDSVQSDGTSDRWIFCYTSTQLPQYYYFHAKWDTVVFDSVSHAILTGPRWISKGWIDSDSAMVLAESQGGLDFRTQNPGCIITAHLGEPLVPNSHPMWYITYISKTNPDNRKSMAIDATQNETSIGTANGKESPFSPESAALVQNYPNPFNQSTVIRFILPERSRACLTVYNAAGQKIETLVDGDQTSGLHEVKWRADGLPSGNYFYVLEVEGFLKTKKLMVLK